MCRIFFILNVRNNFRFLKSANILRIRNLAILRKFLSSSILNNSITKRISFLVNYSVKFIKNNLKIIFTKTDKENITVVLDRNSYIEKNHTNIISDNISHNISDPNTKLVKNPLNKLSRNVQELLKKKWKKKNYISESTYKKLATNDRILSRAYALSKIHT